MKNHFLYFFLEKNDIQIIEKPSINTDLKISYFNLTSSKVSILLKHKQKNNIYIILLVFSLFS